LPFNEIMKMKKLITICSFEKCNIILTTMLLFVLSTSSTVQADMIYYRPNYSNQTWSMGAEEDNNGFYFGLDLQGDQDQNFFGNGKIALSNLVQKQQLTLFFHLLMLH